MALAAAGAAILSLQPAAAQTPPPQETPVTRTATGTFDVKLTPQPVHTEAEGLLGRMSLDKQFHGDLQGGSRGEMLAISSEVAGSAGYVAMERFTGSLAGRTGTFALQHSGVMNRGAAELSIHIVPDSGTEGLQGITGTMKIIIEQGRHSYELEYTLPD
jgi:hypothetical protein